MIAASLAPFLAAVEAKPERRLCPGYRSGLSPAASTVRLIMCATGIPVSLLAAMAPPFEIERNSDPEDIPEACSHAFTDLTEQ